MKRLLIMLGILPIELSPYPLAEGKEEQRIKRQILRNITKHRACAAAGGLRTAGCGQVAKY